MCFTRAKALNTERTHVEADIPALEPRAQAPSRLSLADGNQSRAQDPERPPRSRPQVAERLILRDHSVAMAHDTPPPTAASPGAFSVSILSNRPDFLKAARARRAHAPAFLLQARERQTGEADGIRIGFTCSKKVGNAVARNRAKRRLREIARLVLPLEGRPGWDYVLVGRKDETASRDFALLQDDLIRALRKVHA
jgi:ribonuclease P protein component